MRISRYLVIATLTLAAASHSWAQAWPTKPIRVVLPWPPGGTVDTIARQIIQPVTANTGWNMFIEYRPGANGMIGAEAVMNSAPDGYTLMYNTGSLAINQVLYPGVRYNVLRDFVPITYSTMSRGSPLVVNASTITGSYKDFIELARARAKQGKPLAYGSPGVGNGTHLTTELFTMRAGIEMLHVPYPGVSQMVTALLAGDIQLLITPGTALQQFIKQGRIRAVAVTGANRLSYVPDAPTLAEMGVPGFPITGTWAGWYAPAKTPNDIVLRINAEIRKALQTPKLKAMLEASGDDPVGSSPEEFVKLISTEIERYAEVVRLAKIKME